MSFADSQKKNYLHSNRPGAFLKPENYQGVFQNWDDLTWELWEEGALVDSLPFDQVASLADLDKLGADRG